MKNDNKIIVITLDFSVLAKRTEVNEIYTPLKNKKSDGPANVTPEVVKDGADQYICRSQES